MAWVQVSSASMPGTPTTWAGSPAITVSGAYYVYRDDVTNNSKIVLYFNVGPVTGASWFAYNIVGNAWVIDSSNLKQVIIKDTSYSQWSSTITRTLEWELGNYSTTTSITIAQEFATSSGTRASLNLAAYGVTIPAIPTVSEDYVHVCQNGMYKEAIPHVGQNGVWKKTKGYIATDSGWSLSK